MNRAPSTRRGSSDTKRNPLPKRATRLRRREHSAMQRYPPTLPLFAIATNSAANWFIVFVGDAIEWKQNV